MRNSKYVIVVRMISHSPKAGGKKCVDEIILKIFTTEPIEIEILNGNMGITLTAYHERLPITHDGATKISIHVDLKKLHS